MASQEPHNYQILDKPTPNDVLCGRGKSTFQHEGNQRFRNLIAEHAVTYKMALTKKQKMQVVLLITDIVIARGGRFLICTSGNSWVDGGRQQGKKKTGHSFRDALRGRVKCIQESMRERGDHLEPHGVSIVRSSGRTIEDSSNESEGSSHTSEEAYEDLDLKISAFTDEPELDGYVEPSSNWRSPTAGFELESHDKVEPSRDWRDLKEGGEYDFMTSGYPSPPESFPVQPSEDWMNPKVDREVENDLLRFFLAKHL